MARSSRFQRQTRGPKRFSVWGQGPSEAGGTITAPGVLLWDTGATLGQDSAATVIRTRGLVTASLIGPATSDGDGYRGAHGIGIASTDAFLAGAVPSPLDDPEWPGWFWFSHFNVKDLDVSDAGAGAVSRSDRMVIDSKAMRILKAGQTLFGKSEFVENGAAVLEIEADCRILLKLS